MGWSAEKRRRNIRLVVYNSRYLILPWVRVEHLASHLLGRMARMLSGEWERVYGHPVYFAETFVDAGRFREEERYKKSTVRQEGGPIACRE